MSRWGLLPKVANSQSIRTTLVCRIPEGDMDMLTARSAKLVSGNTVTALVHVFLG